MVPRGQVPPVLKDQVAPVTSNLGLNKANQAQQQGWHLLTQIARHWSHLILEYWRHLTPGHHLSPKTEVETMEKISHQRNSLIQMIARMMWDLAMGLRTGYYHSFVA
jgi:hypothetical protein